MKQSLIYLSRNNLFYALIFTIMGGAWLFAQNDTIPYPFEADDDGGLFLNNYSSYEVEYDVVTDQYVLYPVVAGIRIGEPIYLTRDEYVQLQLEQEMNEYYREKSREYDLAYRYNRFGQGDKNTNIIPSLNVKSKLFETIFGGTKIELIPKGFASLDLGIFSQKIDNPQLLPQNRQNFAIDLQQRIQMSVTGKVGENLSLAANYDTQAGFAFENRMNLAWRPNFAGPDGINRGGEDNIIQNIEFGNVSMPLSTSLIQGAQALEGIKGEFKFGKTYITTVFSRQQSEARNITVQGGGVVSTYKIFAKDYDYNQHFFFSQYFRDNYDDALAVYPTINSDINIIKLEVYKIDRNVSNPQNRRGILALRDLGESTPTPNNGAFYNQIIGPTGLNGNREMSNAQSVANALSLEEGEDFITHENVRLLSPNEYTFQPSLGYISLNQPLGDNNDLLAVAFQYTRNSDPNTIYQVGEFSNDVNGVLVLKLLKSNTIVNTSSPMWDLMMKNVYSLPSSNVDQEDFLMQVLVQDPAGGSADINYLPGTNSQDLNLLQLLNMDRLNQNGNVQADPNNPGVFGDGLFDYLPGLTMNPQLGKIIFTSVEPFGEYLDNKLAGTGDDFVFNELYDNLPINIEQDPLANRYTLQGRFKSQGGDGIPLGAFNVPQGSVRVTANGQTLTEGVDYTVDYNLGRVKILRSDLQQSGVPINISIENQSTFNLQTRRLWGLNAEHRFSEDFFVGATVMNYQERPLTQKANYGYEPVSNTMFGVNAQLSKDAPFLTKWADKLPGIDTDAPSKIDFNIEAAYLLPGQSKAVDNQSYIDDFEDSQSRINLATDYSWQLASTPEDFTNGGSDDLSYGYERGLISWYTIDPRFFGVGGNSPGGISNEDLSNHRSRRVEVQEIYGERDLIAGNALYTNTFDVTFYPEEEGPYNFNPVDIPPQERWGGLMRPINYANFRESNIEYIEFWMMDPFADGTGSDGELIIHLGNVSEDVLRDGELMYENGVNDPNDTPTTTVWGEQPDDFPVLYTFDTEGDARRQQDVGYDGLISSAEAAFFPSAFVNPITGESDPAKDDFVFYFDDRWNANTLQNVVTDRYRYFRNPENNSPSGTLDAATTEPDVEDLNRDYNLDRTENYNEYKLNIDGSLASNSFVVATKTVDVTFEDGSAAQNDWYLVRIPVDAFEAGGSPDVLTGVRFMRMIMKGFTEETTLRFATMDLVRSEWIRYGRIIFPEGNEGTGNPDISNLEIGTVDIEENFDSQPPYVVPPGIRREELQSQNGIQSQNEQSMTMTVKGMGIEEARGVIKSTNLDLRRYKNLRMFVHAEDLKKEASNRYDFDKNSKFFIRIGSDLSDNYYEYEITLKYTPKTATSPFDIWPEENIIDIVTDLFVEAKKQRDRDIIDGTLAPGTERERQLYLAGSDDYKKIYVKGRPSLGNISSIMLGVRNDRRSIDTEDLRVWVNELRLAEIDNEGGYAATSSLTFNLADFAQVNASGSYSSVGFGPIDRGPSERAQESIAQYAVDVSMNLDKFLPEKWGVQLPLSASFSEQFIDPKFNPLDNDVLFEEDPRREELEDVVRTYSAQKRIGFNNIRKVKVGGKQKRFYDIENFSFSFLYADDYFRDIYTQYRIRKDLRIGGNYNFSFKPLNLEPFKELKILKDPDALSYLEWLKAFNFNPVPTSISFRADIIRTYTEQQFRDVSQFYSPGGNTLQFDPIYSNNFLLNWQYNITHNLTRSIRVNYTSSTSTLNDGTRFATLDRQMIWGNLFEVGRPVNYNHNLQINYRTPLNLLPYLYWTSLEIGYQTQYDWTASSPGFVDPGGDLNNPNDDVFLGNVGQNTQAWNVVGQLNFNQLYDRIGAFKKLDEIRLGRQREIDSLNRAYESQAKVKRKSKLKSKSYKFKNRYKAKHYALMILSAIKSANINYTQNNGTILPGLLSEPTFFGTGQGGGPDFRFIFGSQFDVRSRAIREGWFTPSDLLNQPLSQTRQTNLNVNVNLEPFKDLRIDLVGTRTFRRTTQQFGFNVPNNNPFVNESANFDVSNLMFSTTFKDADELYNQLLLNAQTISQRRGATIQPDGYTDGYSILSGDVLVPAFIATYEGRNADGVPLDYKREIPLPNWNLVYSGLTRIPWINRRFERFELRHAYTSSFTANNVLSNINFFNNSAGRDLNNNLFTKFTYGSLTMIESFAPFVGVDMTLRNSMQLRAQFNRNRLIALNLTNYSLTEEYGNEIVVGAGYIFKDVQLGIRFKGKRKKIKGDLNMRLDLRISDNETVLRDLLENNSQTTGGQTLTSIVFKADYNFSQNFTLQFFYDQQITKYKISTAFPISTVRSGLRATFNF